MLTKNFIKYLYGCSYPNGTRNNRTVIVTDVDGNEVEGPARGGSNEFLKRFTESPATTGGDFWLVLGDGNTPPTLEDYKLENEVTGLTTLAGDCILNGNGKIRIYRTYANNTANDISVSEVGLVARVNVNNGNKPVLIAREVLGSKYVIKSGGGTDVRHRHWVDTALNALYSMFCSSFINKEVAA